MGLLIDSSVLIAAERGRIRLQSVLAGNEDESLAISVVTASELLYGIYRAKTVEQAERRRQFVNFVLALFPIIPIDLEVAHHHARIWAGLQTRGEMIGPYDLMIAASALASGYKVVTFNVDEFTRVPGLQVVTPIRQ
ncbi:MAG: PIN domain-containing protein [Caldilinea sp.]